MNCCEDQKSEKKPSIQPKSPQAKLPQTGYQKRAVQRREEKINVDIQPEQKEQSQHLFDFRRQLERDVNTNKHQLNQLIDRIDNIPDFTEYQKIQQQIIDINFKSIGKYLLTSINQNSTDSIVEQMHQPYHLLIQVKKQLKFQALSFIYFLQKIQELINQGIIRDNQIFENNKKKLRQIDSKVCQKLEQVIERVKLLQKRKIHEDESSSEVKEGSVKIEYNLRHEIQLKNERIHTLALQKQRLKTQNEMYEMKLNPMHKAIQAMHKNISSICQKLQVSPSISSVTSKYDFENEQKWKKTMSELQFNRNEVIRLKQQLADSQKRLSEITVTSESSNIKNKQIQGQLNQIAKLEQLVNSYKLSQKQKQIQYILNIQKLTQEKEEIQKQLENIKIKFQNQINELQKSKQSLNTVEQLLSNQRQMEYKLKDYRGQNQVLKNKLQQLQSQLIQQKQLVMSVMTELEEQKSRNANKYTSTFLQQRTFFIGDILETKKQQKKYLITTIQQHMNMFIEKTRILYEYKKDKSKNFHQLVDGHSNLVLIIETPHALFAGYYSGILQEKTPMTEEGLIISLNNFKFYTLNNLQNNPRRDPNDTRIIRGMVYDKYFFIIGNAEIRIRNGEDKVFSNFGISNAFFDNKREKVDALLGEGIVNEVKFTNYEIHEVFFDQNCVFERVE